MYRCSKRWQRISTGMVTAALVTEVGRLRRPVVSRVVGRNGAHSRGPPGNTPPHNKADGLPTLKKEE